MKRNQLTVRAILICALIVAVVAPFTFLKNESTQTNTQPDEQNNINDIKPLKALSQPKVIEKPLHDVDLPDFAGIQDIATKKKTFFAFIRPAIEAKNKQLADERKSIEYWHEQVSLGLGLTDKELQALNAFIKTYRINEEASTLQQINNLLLRVDTIPTSLVLVQAANESAWGTSRFARIGLNFFGIWCYQKGCGMVPNGRNTGAKHEVAAFKSIDEAISAYFNNINKHNAYHVFRTVRAELRAENQPLSAEILATGLLPYSERGSEYVLDLIDMLRHNRKYL